MKTDHIYLHFTYQKRLGDLEKDKSFSELDFKITEKEVMLEFRWVQIAHLS